jgi:ribonuclease D
VEKPPSPVPYDLIQTGAALGGLIESLRARRVRRLAIDVEGENNLHSYGIRVALIQLYDGERGYIVDPLAVRDKPLLSALLENAPWRLVWFDAGNDLLSFQHDLGLRPSPILDCAIATRMLGRTGGLHAFTGQEGSASAKDRFQRSNWLRRPLSKPLLDYAISDVLCLLDLADALTAELGRKGLLEDFDARNREAQDMVRTWDPLANFTRIPGFNRLTREGRHRAQVLWYAREYYARRHDLAPTNVAAKQDLKAVIDRGLREPEAIARFLNKGRNRNLIATGDLADCLGEAERDVEAGARGGSRTEGRRGGPGEPRP